MADGHSGLQRVFGDESSFITGIDLPVDGGTASR